MKPVSREKRLAVTGSAPENSLPFVEVVASGPHLKETGIVLSSVNSYLAAIDKSLFIQITPTDIGQQNVPGYIQRVVDFYPVDRIRLIGGVTQADILIHCVWNKNSTFYRLVVQIKVAEFDYLQSVSPLPKISYSHNWFLVVVI